MTLVKLTIKIFQVNYFKTMIVNKVTKKFVGGGLFRKNLSALKLRTVQNNLF